MDGQTNGRRNYPIQPYVGRATVSEWCLVVVLEMAVRRQHVSRYNGAMARVAS